MFGLNWLNHLRVAHKLIALLMPCLAAFVGLAGWNGYADRVIYNINQQVDGAYKMRGDIMAAALTSQHFASAVENQIPDTIHLKREELHKIMVRMSESNEWIEKLDDAAIVNAYTSLVLQIKRVSRLEAKAGQGVLDQATLLGNMAATFNQSIQTHIDDLIQERLKLRGDLDMFNIIVIMLGALISAMMAYWIIRSLLVQLGGEPGYAVKIAGSIAEGDLTVVFDTRANDQSSLLFAMKRMSESLVNIVSDVRAATDSISTGAKQIAAGNADLSQRTEEQASSLRETASSMEQLTATVRQNADNARQANQLAANNSEVAVKGGQVVGEVVQTMSSISESSKKIVDIISVIEGIAFQTNILALNAAVEAARAGEQGRGFAVVAGEVRNLAQRSAAAAKEIKALIGDSVDKVNTGSMLVDQAGETMSEIVRAAKRVTDIMSEISAASSEQSKGIEQVNQTIAQMDNVTQQNAALVEQAAASAKSMQEQAHNLMEAVSIFKLDATRERTLSAIAQPAIAHDTSTVIATGRKMHKLVTAKDGKDGVWKEF